ncbi:MAG: hypothetical protein ACWA5L_05280 [bacterium]
MMHFSTTPPAGTFSTAAVQPEKIWSLGGVSVTLCGLCDIWQRPFEKVSKYSQSALQKFALENQDIHETNITLKAREYIYDYFLHDKLSKEIVIPTNEIIIEWQYEYDTFPTRTEFNNTVLKFIKFRQKPLCESK